MSGKSATGGRVYGTDYYLKGALAGGICCGFTHSAVCPVDVVKTRMQLEPTKYSKGMIDGFKQVIRNEGYGALATGLGPTAVGYFIQGWFKFGGVEVVKIAFAERMDIESAWKNRNAITMCAAACAEFVADIFLCPLEATRIKLVANPSFASGLLTGMPKVAKEEGILTGFYSGFGPILFKQIPYTIAKFVVQQAAADVIYGSMGKTPGQCSGSTNVSVSLASGTIAGVVAAIISHPADTLLSKVNKKGAGGEGNAFARMAVIAKETGFMTLCTQGLGARCVMIGTLTALQFGIFDTVMQVLGASKFHFKDPAKCA